MHLCARPRGSVRICMCVQDSGGSDMRQPLKAKVNGLTVRGSGGLTVACTQGESSTAAAAAARPTGGLN